MLRGLPEETYWHAGLLILFLCIAPPYLWRLGSGMMSDRAELTERGVIVPGEITGTSRDYYPNGGTYAHYVHYAFPVADARYEGRELLPRGPWSNYVGRIGQPIDVLYLPRDPGISRLAEVASSNGGGQAARMASLGLAGLGGIGLVLVLRAGLRARRTGGAS